MKNSLIFAFTVIGTIIGAGYATGQELMSFFIIKSNHGFRYFLLSSFLIITMCLIIFLYSKKRKISTMEGLFSDIFGNLTSKFFLVISTLFLFACFCVTSAGTGSLFKESFDFPYFWGVLTIILITYAAMQFDINGVFFINAILTPVITISIIILGIITLKTTQEVSDISSYIIHTSSALFGALMYFGYNFLSLIPIVVSSVKKVNKKAVTNGLILSFLIILMTGGIMIICMCSSHLDLNFYNLPFLKIVSDISIFSKNLYSVIMYFAMITTAVSCFYGFFNNISNYIRGRGETIIIFCLILAFFITLMGFSNLVRNIYSLFGILGILISVCSLIMIIIKNI